MTQQPPAAPTLHPKRCETCENTKCEFHPENKRNPCCCHEGMYEFWHYIARCGCASHSSTPDADARQRIEELDMKSEYRKGYCDGSGIPATGRNPDGTYDFSTVADWRTRAAVSEKRIEDVVKELERVKLIYERDRDSRDSNSAQWEVSDGVAFAYGRALSLLKGEKIE